MTALVSICIPSCNRPALVRQAVASSLAQTYAAIEVLISDDSRDDASERALASWIASGRVKYRHNPEALGQAANLNRLLDWAAGEAIVVLHDDDLLLPDAIETLIAARANSTVVYGKQYVIRSDGQVDAAASEALNASHFRTAARRGVQPSALWAALATQFPNDGYIVDAGLARRVRFSEDVRVGSACDLDFGIRLAAAGGTFHFVDAYTAQYRVSDRSISQDTNYSDRIFDVINGVDVPAQLQPLKQARLRQFAMPAVSAHLRAGRRGEACAILRSPAYPKRRLLTFRGMAHAVLLALPVPFSAAILNARRKADDA